MALAAHRGGNLEESHDDWPYLVPPWFFPPKRVASVGCGELLLAVGLLVALLLCVGSAIFGLLEAL